MKIRQEAKICLAPGETKEGKVSVEIIDKTKEEEKRRERGRRRKRRRRRRRTLPPPPSPQWNTDTK